VEPLILIVSTGSLLRTITAQDYSSGLPGGLTSVYRQQGNRSVSVVLHE